MFAKLWRWIKETAWIQPLLIVGAIFALIFSIPYFTSWIQSLSADSANYFARYQLTLEGEPTGNSTSMLVTSDADKITKSIYDNSNFDYKDDFEVEESAYNDYGYKYFLVFCDSDSSGISDVEDAFEALSDGWGVTYNPSETTRPNGDKVTESLRIHTIFTDETSSNDEDDGMEDDSAFERYLKIMSDFFEESGSRFMNYTPYKVNSSAEDTNYDNYANADADSFSIPTIILVDYTQEAASLTNTLGEEPSSTNVGRVGASEVLFSVTGDTKYDKAELLIDMWNHTDTSDKTNMFSIGYSKN